MRITTSLQSQHSNFGWKIFSINFRGFSKNELKTDFSCEPDDGSSETCFSPVNPRWRQVRYGASVFKCSKFSYSFYYFTKITFLYPPPPFWNICICTYICTSQNRFLGKYWYNAISSTQFLKTGSSFHKSPIGLYVRKSYLFGKVIKHESLLWT